MDDQQQPKPKRERTEAQMAALEKARAKAYEVRKENAALRKAEREAGPRGSPGTVEGACHIPMSAYVSVGQNADECHDPRDTQDYNSPAQNWALQ